ncbi:putative methyltransferase [Hamiltosporidium magnivora]|uniref:Methyltransferase-like protein 5 n=1 Tax=Hamiltosporidium magnivora TaxID=148818 RepID=A0A4Q9LNM1_9MICR|nr:putative methyltransferase [Hamiltosporidium magnivora]TBU10009.1 putative methyltransferase [Hamiltosporidium magnivora]
MKLKEIKCKFQEVKGFENPNINLEQYITPPDIAASIIYTAHVRYDDIQNKNILDMCCGTGMLTYGISFFNPFHITCADVCMNALRGCRDNILNLNIENVSMLRMDFTRLPFSYKKFDVVFMNPPFGTKQAHADTRALESALYLSDTVYSLHKSSTRSFILKRFPSAEVIACIKYDLPSTYSFHKKKNVAIEVDLIRIKV